MKSDLTSANGKLVFLTNFHTCSSYNYSKNSNVKAYHVSLSETGTEQIIKNTAMHACSKL